MCKTYSKLGMIKEIPQPDLQCYICMEEQDEKNLRTLCDNNHQACKNCAINTHQFNEECPFCRSESIDKYAHYRLREYSKEKIVEQLQMLDFAYKIKQNNKWLSGKTKPIDGKMRYQLKCIILKCHQIIDYICKELYTDYKSPLKIKKGKVKFATQKEVWIPVNYSHLFVLPDENYKRFFNKLSDLIFEINGEYEHLQFISWQTQSKYYTQEMLNILEDNITTDYFTVVEEQSCNPEYDDVLFEKVI